MPEQDTSNASKQTVREWTRERVAVHTKHSPCDVADDVPLYRYGLDSLYAVTLCLEVQERFGLVIEPTTIWDNPTVEKLATFIEGELSVG
ncbi:acyl carrier protein [Allokutzneria sp. A3M-2-11 16]|uniref:acyl carrier protein n=1 Tax=Allokutzneria sp. A3M-2-11 16 TaxID=2962043 RepID=UPI0020B78067|nr:acyl carrier protein [Allokutzneria sp. A3M-2-11 16]MCP3801988.1 acyl carrier protein [Allokutzneria sp. A3M-2-11 16]